MLNVSCATDILICVGLRNAFVPQLMVSRNCCRFWTVLLTCFTSFSTSFFSCLAFIFPFVATIEKNYYFHCYNPSFVCSWRTYKYITNADKINFFNEVKAIHKTQCITHIHAHSRTYHCKNKILKTKRIARMKQKKKKIPREKITKSTKRSEYLWKYKAFICHSMKLLEQLQFSSIILPLYTTCYVFEIHKMCNPPLWLTYYTPIHYT